MRETPNFTLHSPDDIDSTSGPTLSSSSSSSLSIANGVLHQMVPPDPVILPSNTPPDRSGSRPLVDNKQTRHYETSVYVQTFDFNQDGTCFIAGTTDGFRVFTCSPLSEFVRRESNNSQNSWPFGSVTSAAMLYRSHCFAFVTTAEPQRVYFWDDRRCQSVGDIWCRYPILNVLLGREIVAVVTKTSIYLYLAGTITPLSVVATGYNPYGICALAESPAIGSWRLACPTVTSGALRVQGPESVGSYCGFVVQAHQSPLSCISLSSTGTLVATASQLGTLIRLFSTSDGSKLHELRLGTVPHRVRCITFREDGMFIAVSSNSRTIHIFKLTHVIEKRGNENQECNGKNGTCYNEQDELSDELISSTNGEINPIIIYDDKTNQPSLIQINTDSKQSVSSPLDPFHHVSLSKSLKSSNASIYQMNNSSTIHSPKTGYTSSSLINSNEPDPMMSSGNYGSFHSAKSLLRFGSGSYSGLSDNSMTTAASFTSALGTHSSSFAALTAAVVVQSRELMQGTLKSVLPKYFTPERSFAQLILPADRVGEVDVRYDAERETEQNNYRLSITHFGRHSGYNKYLQDGSSHFYRMSNQLDCIRNFGPLCAFAGSRSNHFYIIHHDGFFYEARFDAHKGGGCQLLSMSPWFAPRRDFTVEAAVALCHPVHSFHESTLHQSKNELFQLTQSNLSKTHSLKTARPLVLDELGSSQCDISSKINNDSTHKEKIQQEKDNPNIFLVNNNADDSLSSMKQDTHDQLETFSSLMESVTGQTTHHLNVMSANTITPSDNILPNDTSPKNDSLFDQTWELC